MKLSLRLVCVLFTLLLSTGFFGIVNALLTIRKLTPSGKNLDYRFGFFIVFLIQFPSIF
ncbi:unnamed protein product [Brassica oleracea]